MDVNVVHYVPALYKNLLYQIYKLKKQVEEQKKEVKRLSVKYGDEVMMNSHLIDILNQHGIRWR